MSPSRRSFKGGTPTPRTVSATSGRMSSVASPTNATPHSAPIAAAPFRAIWNGIVARVGASRPTAVEIRSFGTYPPPALIGTVAHPRGGDRSYLLSGAYAHV